MEGVRGGRGGGGRVRRGRGGWGGESEREEKVGRVGYKGTNEVSSHPNLKKDYKEVSHITMTEGGSNIERVELAWVHVHFYFSLLLCPGPG